MKILAISQTNDKELMGYFYNPMYPLSPDNMVTSFENRIEKQGFYFDIWTKTLLLEVY